MTDTSNY